MSTAQVAYRAMLRDAIAPALHALGFRGSGRLYKMDDDNTWARLGFQASRYNIADETRFTINLAVVNRDTWRNQQRELNYLPEVPSPGIHYGNFLWQKRIGHLMPERNDVWWTLFTGQATAPVASEVLAAIRDYAVPALTEQQATAASA